LRTELACQRLKRQPPLRFEFELELLEEFELEFDEEFELELLEEFELELLEEFELEFDEEFELELLEELELEFDDPLDDEFDELLPATVYDPSLLAKLVRFSSGAGAEYCLASAALVASAATPAISADFIFHILFMLILLVSDPLGGPTE